MQTITPFLWFDGKAEDAAYFYLSVFEDSAIVSTMRSGAAMPGAQGGVVAVTFRVQGREFIAFNGGPHFTFTPAVSLFVSCETQAEVDDLWAKLTADGGEPSRCGWLKDKFGLSWQIVPAALGPMLQDTDGERAGRVMSALMAMGKLDLAALRQAYDGA